MLFNKTQNSKHKGFSLIEVMIAVVVFSFGLLGVAGMLAYSIKAGHNGYMRSQAIFLVSSMGDMIRGSGDTEDIVSIYNGSGYSGYSDVSAVCLDVACNETELVERNILLWSNMISLLLPHSSGSISCVDNLCEIKVVWTEANEVDVESLQEIVMVISP